MNTVSHSFSARCSAVKLGPLLARSGSVALAIAIAGLVVGCKDEMCPPNPLPEPWKAYEAVIPGETVICGNSRSPGDDNPSTTLFVYYKGLDSFPAFDASAEKLKAAGFAPADISTVGEGDHQIFSGKFVKGDVTIDLDVNKNPSGIQGMFKLTNGPAAP
jgi:hypothetical protein